MSNDNTKPFIHLLNDDSPELHYLKEKMKLVACEYRIAFNSNIQDIGTPNALSDYFLSQVVEQSK